MRLLLALLLLLVVAGPAVAHPAARPAALRPDQAAPPERRVVWIPLDSRPVNTAEVQLFGAAAGARLLLPPTGLLDHGPGRPADPAALLAWWAQQGRRGDTAVLYTNTLLAGGLVSSRDPAAYRALPDRLAALQSALRAAPRGRRILVHVLPRAEPDPGPERLAALVAESEHLLQRLLAWVAAGWADELLVGIDDGRPGSPVTDLLHRVEGVARAQGLAGRVHLHWGADEIGFLLLAREALRQSGFAPALVVEPDQPAAGGLTLPYEAAPLARSVAQKLAFLGARPAPGGARLFLHTGRADDDGRRLPERLAAAYGRGERVALADLSGTGGRDAALVARVAERIPLPEVLYAGWNTASNSLGSALAAAAVREWQGAVGAGDRARLALATFQAIRWAHDLLWQPERERAARWASDRVIDPQRFGPGEPAMAAHLAATWLPQAQRYLADLYGEGLVVGGQRICPTVAAASFPWERTFEVALRPQVGTCRPPGP